MEAVRTYTAQMMPSLKAVNFNYILSVKNMSFVCLFFFFRHLKITLDSEQPRLKEKLIILSLRWNKKFWTFPKRRVFFWLCIRFLSWFCVQLFTFFCRAELKLAFIVLLVVYSCCFFLDTQIYYLCKTSFTWSLSSVKDPRKDQLLKIA